MAFKLVCFAAVLLTAMRQTDAKVYTLTAKDFDITEKGIWLVDFYAVSVSLLNLSGDSFFACLVPSSIYLSKALSSCLYFC